MDPKERRITFAVEKVDNHCCEMILSGKNILTVIK